MPSCPAWQALSRCNSLLRRRAPTVKAAERKWKAEAVSTASLTELLDRDGIILAPGVFDGFSARLADRAGFDALYMTGYGVSASRYGLPDAGLVGLGEMVDALRMIRSVTTKPIIADADTGYGGLLNVRHTVRQYEAAGASAIQIEDQDFPKKCGHTLGRRLIGADEMVAKVTVAVEARQNADTLIIARTDARTEFGLEEAIARARAYHAAGADILFVESPESEQELETIGRALDAPLLANMVGSGGRTPELPASKLHALGFKIAIYPGIGFGAALPAMEGAFAHLRQAGEIPKNGPQPITGAHKLVGFPEIWALEKDWDKRFREE
ncbi:MAG TPA: carboxyvinyl-carboxyphosphonate phosphorylmutase [Alphaproteobacteria bacterium]|nr:carboxyvinyl-carboxyphosphonate phosphorylmutase [Alphaproteobacteria bacterium]